MNLTANNLRGVLAACGPVTSADVAAFFPDYPRRDVASALSRLCGAKRKTVRIASWEIPPDNRRQCPVPHYALGSGPCAKRPGHEHRTVIEKRWRQRQAIPRVPCSVWAYAEGFAR